jgi:di/tricarboxylate transporter
VTLAIWKLVAVLAGAVALFVTKKVRVDLVALMVLVSLVLLGLLTPAGALSGFSNPAVVTVWAVFILSGGLSRTGIAGIVGRQILRVAGTGEARLVVLIMVTAAFLSAFMNNVGVAALLLPVVIDLAGRTRIAPSKLLIPLAYSTLLGGLMTLIGTPPNILVTEALARFGETPFRLFSFTPIGGAVVVAGILFMATIGRRLLPENESLGSGAAGGADLAETYRVKDDLSVIRVPEGSAMVGRTLAESRLGSLLGVNVLAVLHAGRHRLVPDASIRFEAGDQLLVEGSPDRLAGLAGRGYLELESDGVTADQLVSADIEIAEVGLTPGTDLEGRTLKGADFRKRFGVVVLAIRRGAGLVRSDLANLPLTLDDVLLVMGSRAAIDALRTDPDFLGSGVEHAAAYQLEERLMRVAVPTGSPLAGKTLLESRLGDRYGLGVMGILREDGTHLVATAEDTILAGDILLLRGRPDDLEAVEGLHQLELDRAADTDVGSLESERVGLAEAVLAPRSRLVGKTLRELHFREKYGLNVVAISREGSTLKTDLGTTPLRFGDALLLHGPRERLRVLGSEPDIIVLAADAQEEVRSAKAPVAAAIMGGVVLSVIVGWLPIYIAAIAGAVAMVLSRCLSMEEAYAFIEWRAVFLIAGMIPLGLAMEQTGAATLFTGVVVGSVSTHGPLAIAAAIFLVTAVGAQVMPTSAVAILMAPIAYHTAVDLGISPHALMMTVAMSASASFLSPVAHPANVLIMGPGGYQWGDYIRVGLPLTVVCLAVVLLLLPVLWPF